MTTRRIIAALVLAVMATKSWALGLGELDLQSALNERFRADIELYDADALEISEIRVSLATADDFDRVGVERFFFLTTLRFEVVKGARGVPVIKVTSTQSISEPYLNFIVEVLWPSGRLLREYTVLLDPPTFTQAAAPPVAPPARTPPPLDRGAPGDGASAPSRTTASSRRPAARSTSGGRTSEAGGDRVYGMTGRSDTAWKIAQDTLPAADVTVQQNMLAIKRLNPRAFIDDNVNRLKAGYVLRTPTAEQARELTPEQAKQRVILENEAWRTGRRLPVAQGSDTTPELKAQVDATRERAPTTTAAPADSGQLRIVAEAGDSAQGASDAQADAQGEQAPSTEEQARLARELDELTYKMDRELENANSELAVKDRQLEVKNQEITELQNQLTTLREEMKRLAENRPPEPAAAAPKPWWQSTTALGGGALGLILLAVGGLFVARRRRAEAEAEFYDSPLAVEPAFEEAEQDLAPDDLAAESWDDAPEDGALAMATDTLEFEDEEVADAIDQANPETTFAEETLPVDEAGSGGETTDVVGEAEIYIAYGRYPQAVTLLTGALSADPAREDVRLKLLELYVETNDIDAFEDQFAQLEERGAEADILAAATEMRARLAEEAIDLESLQPEPETPASDELGLDEPVAEALSLDELALPEAPTVDLADADLTKEDDDFNLELDSLTELPEELADDAVDDPLAAFDDAVDNAVDDAPQSADDFDFELDLDDALPEDTSADESGVATVAALSTASASDQLGGDLGLDFDPDADGSAQGNGAEAANGSEAESTGGSLSAAGFDDDLLDLDDILNDESMDEASLEGAADGTSAVAESDESAEEDFDFDIGDDSTSTKLDLARAYIDMGDQDGARDILNEVLTEGSETQQQEAQELLGSI